MPIAIRNRSGFRRSRISVPAGLCSAIVGALVIQSTPALAHDAAPAPAKRIAFPTLSKAQLNSAVEAQAEMASSGLSVIGSFATQNQVKGALIARGVPMIIDNPIIDAATLATKGFVPSHGWVTFKGEGLAFGRPPDANAFELDKPYVLLYAPMRSLSDAALTDQIPDPPYQLVGAAWFKDYEGTALMTATPTETPPTMDPVPDGLLPGGGWFRHSAGCHLSNGQFVAFNENLPAPSATRAATGIAWCQAIGLGSTFAGSSPEPTTLERGECRLSRDLNATIPRPIMDGSTVLTNRPPFPQLLPPGAEPYVRPEPTIEDSGLLYLADLTVWIAQKAIHSAWSGYGVLYRASLNALRVASNVKCNAIALEPNVNIPTFWHGAAWDAHLFFRPDGTTTAGIVDYTVIPNGYVGPSIAFTPVTDFAHVLDIGAAPLAPQTAVLVGGNAQAYVSWTPPSDPSGAGVVPLPITGYEVTVTKPGSPSRTVTVAPNLRQTVISGLSGGTYTASVKAINNTDTGAAKVSSSAVIGGTGPQVTWSYHGNPPTSRGFINGSLSADITATDATGVAKIQWWSDAEPTVRDVVPASGSPTTLTALGGVGTPGARELYFKAIDTDGNESPITTLRGTVTQFAPMTPTFGTVNTTEWMNHDVAVTWNAVDFDNDLDRDASSPNPVFITTEGAASTAVVRAVDAVGRVATATTPAVKIDKTAPTSSVSGIPTGWTNRPVTATFSTADSLSGVDSVRWFFDGPTVGEPVNRFTTTATMSDEGEYTLNWVVTDRANNISELQSVPFRIDKTAPSLTGAVSSRVAPNAAGWLNTDAVIEWSASDAASGVDTATLAAASRISSEGSAMTITNSVSDLAGNTTTATSPPVNIDKTPPVSSMTLPSSFGTTVVLSVSSSDTLSGVAKRWTRVDGRAAVEGAAVTVSTPGSHVVEYWSQDVAGNVETPKSVSFSLSAPSSSIVPSVGSSAPTTSTALAAVSPTTTLAPLIPAVRPETTDRTPATSTVAPTTIAPRSNGVRSVTTTTIRATKSPKRPSVTTTVKRPSRLPLSQNRKPKATVKSSATTTKKSSPKRS
jgi:Fibronectin type III domain